MTIKEAYLLGRESEELDLQQVRKAADGEEDYKELEKWYFKGWEEAHGLGRNK